MVIENTDKILRCPFCGGTAALSCKEWKRGRQFIVCVKCRECGGRSKSVETAVDPVASNWSSNACLDAIRFWNLRDGAVETRSGETEIL